MFALDAQWALPIFPTSLSVARGVERGHVIRWGPDSGFWRGSAARKLHLDSTASIQYYLLILKSFLEKFPNRKAKSPLILFWSSDGAPSPIPSTIRRKDALFSFLGGRASSLLWLRQSFRNNFRSRGFYLGIMKGRIYVVGVFLMLTSTVCANPLPFNVHTNYVFLLLFTHYDFFSVVTGHYDY